MRDVVHSGLRLAGPHDEDWERDLLVDDLIERLQLDPNAEFTTLSGGLKLSDSPWEARLAGRPDLLLIADEPKDQSPRFGVDPLARKTPARFQAFPVLRHSTTGRFFANWRRGSIELDRGRLCGMGLRL